MPRLERSLRAPRLAAAAALAAILAGCQLPLERAACPCAARWTCCADENICVAEEDQCLRRADPGADAGSEDGGAAEVQRLELDDAWLRDGFGRAVALAGDVAGVGVPGRDATVTDEGAVVLFERRGGGAGVWVRTAVLAAPDPVVSGGFGSALSFAGDGVLVVGAPGEAEGVGRVHIFRRAAGVWSWSETIAPDLTGVPADRLDPSELHPLQFGWAIAADGDRIIVATAGLAADIYDITLDGAVHRARLNPPDEDVGFGSAVAIHDSSAAVASGWPFSLGGAVHVFDEALGWAAPARVSDMPGDLPSYPALAVDGERLALSRGLGVVRIVERTESGWGLPEDVALPAEPEVPAVVGLTWHGDDLLATTSQVGSGVGLAKIQSIAGAWQPDPLIPVTDVRDGTGSALATSGERLLIGIGGSQLAAAQAGQATFFRVGQEGLARESTITLHDGQMSGAMAVDRGRILASTVAGEQTAWFERDEDGRYRRRPSLVIDSDTRLDLPVAVSGRHALAIALRAQATDLLRGVQTFELGDGDWVAGPFLVPPANGVAAAVAVDGDTAVIGVEPDIARPVVALVYTWSSAGWELSATLEGPPHSACDLSVAVSGDRIALSSCSDQLRLFERAGQVWNAMPAPTLAEATSLGPSAYHLSGDRLGIVSLAAADHHGVSDVFRWVDGHWINELHLRTSWVFDDCHHACNFGIGALAGDRMVLFRDATSVIPYRFEEGAWVEQPPIELPPGRRSPEAFVSSVALTDDELVVSVPTEAGRSDPQAGAIYAFPWR